MPLHREGVAAFEFDAGGQFRGDDLVLAGPYLLSAAFQEVLPAAFLIADFHTSLVDHHGHGRIVGPDDECGLVGLDMDDDPGNEGGGSNESTSSGQPTPNAPVWLDGRLGEEGKQRFRYIGWRL